MTKAVKELCIVFLVGVGVLTLMWGLFHQVNTSSVPGQEILASRVMWSAVGIGAGLVVIGAALGLFLKPAK